MSRKYPEEVVEYIVNNYSIESAASISKNLEELFNFECSVRCIHSWASKHGLNKKLSFTNEQAEWLKNNYQFYLNTIPLTKEFNKHFGMDLVPTQIRTKLNRLVPGEKFKHSGGKLPGQGFSVTSKPVGSEVFKGGYWWVKINDDTLPKHYKSSDRYKNWKQKHHVIWEELHGTIPRGCKVVFLDGDRNNFDGSNLYCVDTRALGYLVRHKMWYGDGPLTLSAIKWAELRVLLSSKYINKLRIVNNGVPYDKNDTPEIK